MNGHETLPLTRSVEPSKLMVAQGSVPLSPFDIGTRPLEHLRQRLGLLLELGLSLGTHLAQGPTGLKPRDAKALSDGEVERFERDSAPNGADWPQY